MTPDATNDPDRVWPRRNDADIGFEPLVRELRACRYCVTDPDGAPLPQEPRPVFQLALAPRIAVCSQAPGTRAHATGKPFDDPSGVRLRSWMGVSDEEFYDDRRVAIVPMGFCFPGHDAKGGDLPPRRECARRWRRQVLSAIGRPDVLLLVGSYAQRWHLPETKGMSLAATVGEWRQFAFRSSSPQVFPLPHPSWRNNAWLKHHPWFERELLPVLRLAVRAALGKA